MAALGVLLLSFLLARHLGPEGVGQFAIGQILVIALSILGKCGYSQIIVRDCAGAKGHKSLSAYCWGRIKKIIFVNTVISLSGCTLLYWFFDAYDEYYWFILSCPFFTYSYIVAAIFKGLGKSVLASMLENGFISFSCSVLMFLALMSGSVLTLLDASFYFFMASVVSSFVGTVFLQIIVFKSDKELSSEVLRINKGDSFAARSFLITELAQFFSQYSFMIVAMLFLTSTDLGYLRVSEQIAATAAFVLIVINLVFSPKFATLYQAGNIDGLSLMARRSSLLALLVSSPVLLLCIFFPELILSAFGKDFKGADTVLLLLIFAQLINIWCGPVAVILAMTNQERLLRKITLAGLIINICLSLILVYHFGLIGAAWAYFIFFMLQNLMLLVGVRLKLNIWSCYLPGFISR